VRRGCVRISIHPMCLSWVLLLFHRISLSHREGGGGEGVTLFIRDILTFYSLSLSSCGLSRQAWAFFCILIVEKLQYYAPITLLDCFLPTLAISSPDCLILLVELILLFAWEILMLICLRRMILCCASEIMSLFSLKQVIDLPIRITSISESFDIDLRRGDGIRCLRRILH